MEDSIELKGVLKLDTKEAENKLTGLGNKVSKEVSAAGKDVVKLPEKTTKALKGLFSGEQGLGNVGRVARSAAGGIKGVGMSLAGVASAGKAASSALGAVLSIIIAIIAIIAKLLQGTDTMEQIKKTISSIVYVLQNILAPNLSLIGDIVATLGRIVNDVLAVLKPAINFTSLFLSFVLDILTALEPIIEVVVGCILKLEEALAKLIKFLTFGLLDLTKAISGSTSGVGASNKTKLDTWATTSDDAYDRLETSSEMFESAVDKFSKLGEGWPEFKERVFGSFVDAWNKVGDFAKKIWSDIKTVAVAIWNPVKDSAIQVWTTVRDWFREIWQKIKDFFGGIGDKVKGIGEGIKKAGSAIKDAFSSAWDKVKTGASNAWGKVKNFFGFADGGTIGSQVWGMNEQGNPEFIFNAGGHDTVINANILSDAMYKAMVKAQGNNQLKIEVGIKEGTSAGARELVQWILPSLKFYTQR